MNKYEEYSFERKQLQSAGKAPSWLTTAGYQMLVERNYLMDGETPVDMYNRIASRADELLDNQVPTPIGYSSWFDAFFDVMWKGWLSPSTPVLTNMGTDRGHPVSCSGTYIPDTIRGFYLARTEIAQLTQRGYGTSAGLDAIRHRGAPISKGGTANGVMQPASGIVDDMKEISQGSSRRGSCGLYLDILHPDFDELADQVLAEDQGWNVGWNLTDNYKALFFKDPIEADRRWTKMLKTKLVKGKGYLHFLDKVNAVRPQMYVDRGYFVKHSNLCSEISLFNDEKHSFTCVLSSVNVAKYEEWKDTQLIHIATVFLDTVIDDMLEKARTEEGFEKVIKFTENTRAIGLGVLGLSTYYQQQMWAFGSLQSIMFNQQFFKRLDDETLKTSKLLANYRGCPEYMKPYGERFSHRIALPPTMSTAEILGGISQGIEPVYANVYEAQTAGGIVYRINPTLLSLMKERGVYNKQTMRRIAENQGSIFAEDWLTADEKEVFRTAFELNQEAILLMASHRQKAIDATRGGQGQSLNLYFKEETPEKEISRLHLKAFLDDHIKSLYYVRTLNEKSKLDVPAPTCLACEG